MAIAEARIGVRPKVAERVPFLDTKPDLFSVRQFTPEDALTLAKRYFNNLPDLKSQPWLLGRTDVQRAVLKMLGQNRLLEQKVFRKSEPGYDPIISLMENVRDLDEKDILKLAEMYRSDRKLYVDGYLEKRGRISPNEETVIGRMDELRHTLVNFGQHELVNLIDRQTDPKSNQINWNRIRSSGHGESM
jgi:hypothetical protein